MTYLELSPLARQTCEKISGRPHPHGDAPDCWVCETIQRALDAATGQGIAHYVRNVRTAAESYPEIRGHQVAIEEE